MKKPYNVISKASLAAIFAASAIVPVATASAEAASAEISKVVYELNGKLISVTMNDFENAIINGEFDLDLDSIKYVQLNNGKNYSMSDYENALINTDSAEDATQSLAEKTTPADISPLEGSYDKDGNVVAEDETPSELEEAKTALTDAIAAAKALENVAEDKQEALTDAIAAAEAAAVATDATVESLKEAKTALETAVSAATQTDEELVAAKAALTAAITTAEGVSTVGKTEESAKALTDAIADAKVLVAKEGVTVAELEAAVKALETAATDLVDAPVAEVTVESVKAITKTSVTVTLAEAVEEATAKDFVVTVGEETVAVTGVTALASDVTGKTFVLAVSLDKKQGTVAVNTVEAVETFDFKAPEVVAVTQTSKNQITVEFSEKVSNFGADSLYELYFVNKPANTLVLNNTITGPASTGNYSAFTAVASEDGKTVTLTIAEPLTNGAYGFNVTGSVVADTAGNQLAAVSKTVAVSGIVNEAPELKTAKYNESTGILTLGTSEGISAIYASKITLTGANGKTVTLADNDITALTSTVLSANTISIKNKINAAGLTLPFTVSLAAEALTDATAVKSVATTAPITAEIVATPKATSVTIDEKSQTVTVTYDKAVKAVKTAVNGVTVKTTVGTTETASTGVVLTGKSTNVDGTTQVFDITNTGSSNFIATSQVASAKVSFPAEAVTDTTELAVKSNAQNDVVVTYVDDTTAPTYTASYNSLTKQFTIVFDEKVNNLALGNLKLSAKEDGSESVNLSSANTETFVTTNAPTYVVTLGTPAAELADANKAVYLVVNANVTDATGNAVKEEQRIVKVDVADYVAPTLLSTTVDNKNQVTIKFSEKVTAATAQNVANYTIFATSNESLKLAVTEAILLADGQTVVLKTADQMATGYTLSVKNVTDASPNANVVSSTTTTGTFTGSADAATKAKVTGASFKDANNSGVVDANDTLEIVFDTELKAGSYSVSDLVLTDAVGTLEANKANFGTGATVTVKADAPNTLVVTLGSGAKFNFGTTKVDVAENTTIKTVVGDVEASTAQVVANASLTAAKISSAVFTEVTEDGKADKGDTIVLTLDRPVAVTYHDDDNTDALKQAALANAFGYNGHKAVLGADKKTVTITLESYNPINWGTTEVNYKTAAGAVSGQAKVANLFGTPNAADATKITPASTVSPTLVGAKYFNTNATGTAGDAIVLTFDKHINKGTLTEADFKLENVTLHGTGQAATYEVNGKELIITLGTGATLAPNATINVKTGGTTNLTDVYGNKTLPAAAALPLAVETDTTAPVLVSATVKSDADSSGDLTKNDVVTLTFSEPVILAGTALTDLVNSTTASAIGTATIEQSTDKKSVDITITSIGTLDTTTPIVTASTIIDFAGNAISAGLYDITIKFSAEQAAAKLVAAAETADDDMSTVTLAKAAKTALDAAQVAVTALADSTEKTALQGRLDAISTAINTKNAAALDVEAGLTSLAADAIKGTNTNLASVKSNLVAPATANGVTYAITGDGTNTAVAATGTVTRKTTDITGTVIVSGVKDGVKGTLDYTVTVLKKTFAAAGQTVANNTFTITPDGYALTDFSAESGSIEFTDGTTTSVIDGLTYTLSYDNTTGVATVKVTGKATAGTLATTKAITVTKDGTVANLTLNIPATTAEDLADTVAVTITVTP